jgi:putative ABC transport system permease protein
MIPMRFYGLLLRLYPASFRHEYGGEMRALFQRRLRDTQGPAGRAALYGGALIETVVNAAIVHWDILRGDLSYARRSLIGAPWFAVTAITVIALGIGATTAAFSVTDFVLIRPLPFAQPDRLVKVWETTPGYSQMELSAPNYRDWKAAATSFESMGMYHFEELTMMTREEPRRFNGTAVSADLFPTLGVAPMLGRTFEPDDDRQGAPPTVILSYRLWQTEFGGDAAIVGRQLVLDNEPYTVIGVMAREFHFPKSDALFWIPTRFGERDYVDSERTNNWLEVVGRLRPGVTLVQARTELQLIARRLEQQFPKENKSTCAAVYALSAQVSQRARLLLVALSGAAACVLLIACANLANLLLARVLSRRREMAVRAAIGAGRERLVRQLMTESLVVAVIGGALGVAIAVAAVPLLSQLVPATLPIAETPSVDMRVLRFALVLTVATGIAFGLAPVVRVGGSRDLEGLREGVRSGGAQRERLRAVLVVTEIAASVVLLVSAGLLIRALLTIQRTDPGFSPEGVLTLRTELPLSDYVKVDKREGFYARVLQDVRALPGVTAAGFISFLPMSSFRGGIWPVSFSGDPTGDLAIRDAANVAALRYVTPGFFDALGVPLKRGRDIRDTDSQHASYVAVVSESFVRRHWPNQDPIGRHFNFAFADREIVGVVGDVKFRGLERESEPQVYLSSKQVEDDSIIFYAPRALAIRSRVPPATLAPPIREIVRRADPGVPITEQQTVQNLIGLDTVSRSVQVRILGAFAAIAFFLAAIGIHGLLGFAVSQRSQEIGVRMALGAQPGDILRMVVSRGITLALAGVIPGIALAYVAGRSMHALLAGITPADPLTFSAVAVLAVVMTIAGTLVPALRAVRVDPISVMRVE